MPRDVTPSTQQITGYQASLRTLGGNIEEVQGDPSQIAMIQTVSRARQAVVREFAALRGAWAGDTFSPGVQEDSQRLLNSSLRGTGGSSDSFSLLAKTLARDDQRLAYEIAALRDQWILSPPSASYPFTVPQGGTGQVSHVNNAVLKGQGVLPIASSGVFIDSSNFVTGVEKLTADYDDGLHTRMVVVDPQQVDGKGEFYTEWGPFGMYVSPSAASISFLGFGGLTKWVVSTNDDLTLLPASGKSIVIDESSGGDLTIGTGTGVLVRSGGIVSSVAALSVSQGGTGLTTIITGAFLTGNGTGNVVPVGPGTSGQIPISSGTAPVMRTVSSDATLSSTGALTIANDAVTYAKFQNAAADQVILGNILGAAHDFQELTAAQVKTMIGLSFPISLANGGTNQTLWTAGTVVQVNAGGTALESTPYGYGDFALATTSILTPSGSGLTGGGTLAADRTLQVVVDSSTIEIATNTLRVKDLGISTAKIAADAVTLAKIQNAAASSKLVGSGSSGIGADYAEITLDASLTMSGTTLSVTTSSFAPPDATYIVQTANSTLTNEQALGALATGLLKNTTTTGVLSIAVAGTDYEAALTKGNLTATTPISLSATRQVIGGAAVISHDTTAGNIHLPTGGASNQLLKNSGSSGTGAWGTVTENSGALAAITTINMSGQLTSTLPTGTAPFVVASTTVVTNLNADLLDGISSAAFGLVANPLSQFAATTSAQLAGVISDETGSGALVFATSPTLVTPILGTPSSGTLTNCTGLLIAGGGTSASDAATAFINLAATSVAFTGDITPSQITADQNNYSPTGLSTASVLRLSTDASRTITGLAGGNDGRILFIHNIGSFNLVLADESVSSTSTNRFALSADVTLTPDQCALIQYDSTSQRWRLIGGSGSGSGAPTNATYIVQTADATLTNEQALGALATGILKNTTTTGVLSIATAGTDYADLAFKTISCPAGTSPVADSAADTLNFANGSGIGITGTSGTDTVTVALGTMTADWLTSATNWAIQFGQTTNAISSPSTDHLLVTSPHVTIGDNTAGGWDQGDGSTAADDTHNVMRPAADQKYRLGTAALRYDQLHVMSGYFDTDIRLLGQAGGETDYIIFKANTDALTANRTITVDVDDASRTLRLGGDLSVTGASTINQDVSTGGSPTFAGLTLTSFAGSLHAAAGVVSALNLTSNAVLKGAGTSAIVASGVSIDSANACTGMTSLVVDTVTIDGTTISTSGFMQLSAANGSHMAGKFAGCWKGCFNQSTATVAVSSTAVETTLVDIQLTDEWALDGQAVHVRMAGTMAGHATITKTFKVYFGETPTAVFSMGAITSANAQDWVLEIMMIRVAASGSGCMKGYAHLRCVDTAGTFTDRMDYFASATAGDDWQSEPHVKVTGTLSTNALANGIVMELYRMYGEDAP